MRTYTKIGDAGFTVRADGRRVRKSDPAIQAVGAIDELSAHVGLCASAARREKAGEVSLALAEMQEHLLAAGSRLAAAGATAARSDGVLGLAVRGMERRIDRLNRRLPKLRRFIIPGGCKLACLLHVARTVCRRAECRVVALADAGSPVPPDLLRYLNRLGELLFILARCANRLAHVKDVTWKA